MLIRINKVLSNPNSTAQESSEVIAKDPGLSAKLLKLVNSAFYGRAMRAVQNVFPTKFDSLPRAVTVIGQNQLATLAMGVAVMTHFKDVPDDLLDMRSFWRHSLAVGFLAKLMASGIEQANAERFFAAGLLHDIGRLLLGKNAPQLMTAILGLALSQGIALREAEQRVLGWDHCALGGLLLRKWQYPEALEKMVAQHHAPSPGEQGAEAAIIQLADFLANALEYGSSGERLVPALPGEAWDMLGIPSEELQAVVEKLDLEFENMLATFLS